MANGNAADSPPFESLEDRAARSSRTAPERSTLVSILEPLASLKLTVTLFAMAIFIVLAGTLAQRYHGIWQVINTYFRQTDNFGFVWVDLAIFFPGSWDVSGAFPFPGGWLIGAALFVNLLAAHALRFKIQAEGGRLWGGLCVIALGIAATAGVIASGMNNRPETQLSDEFASLVWNGVRLGMVLLTIGLGYMLYIVERDRRGTAYWILFGLVNLLALFNVLLFANPELRIDKPGLRIMWQLMKGVGAAAILLAGSVLVFRRKAAIVVLHAGVALMMIGELWTGMTADERNMPIFEGYPGYYLEDIRVPELAVIDHSDPDHDREVVVPRAILVQHDEGNAEPIRHEELPFDIRVDDFFDNVEFAEFTPADVDPLMKGLGQTMKVEGRPMVTGADTNEGSDAPSAYVELLDKASGESLGKYLVSVLFTLDPMENRQYVAVGDKFYEIALRFKRDYAPATFDYKDFRFDKYVGTDRPKNFSATLQLVDDAKGFDGEVHIWMNNPLRYDGRTYYQSSTRRDPRFPAGDKLGTVLQVVENESWMIPYTGCAIVGVGMGAHFLLALLSFLKRRRQQLAASPSSEGIWSIVVPAALVLCAAAYYGSQTRPASSSPGEMQIEEVGRLPVAYQGRVKPLDTVARNALRVISDRETFDVKMDQPGEKEPEKKKLPAIVWLLDWISGAPGAREHEVVRIDNLEVLGMLGLERRKRYRYSVSEVVGEDPHTNYLQYRDNLMKAAGKDPDDRTPLDNQIIKTETRLRLMMELQESFAEPQFGGSADVGAQIRQWQERMQGLRTSGVFAVPPDEAKKPWNLLQETYVLNQVLGEKNEFADPWYALLKAYRERNVAEFNKQARELRELYEEKERELQSGSLQESVAAAKEGGVAHAEQLNLSRVSFESWYNHFNPFAHARVFYVVAFVLSILAWLFWGTTFNRAALWLLAVTFVVHTFGLAARIYISGRPPVTNLYSSAVFIGWGCVLLGMIFEGIYKLGFGNIMASIAGFTTLLISHQLAADGDTMQVLQAVLDTNFWLATHVVCITLGYATTFVAGLFGILYIFGDSFLPSFGDEKRKALTRMTYGTLCFAILFSFIGTVLGGLWADDSWGRFWGWDPKENGALLIVIWNALVLHARWGGMAGPRGVASLAVFGNVVTAWSWFGVNQLGVGLHSYGFTSGITFWLTVFAASQLLIVGLGAIPSRVWHGGNRGGAEAA